VEVEKDNEAEEMIPLPEGYRTRRILKAAAANGTYDMGDEKSGVGNEQVCLLS